LVCSYVGGVSGGWDGGGRLEGGWREAGGRLERETEGRLERLEGRLEGGWRGWREAGREAGGKLEGGWRKAGGEAGGWREKTYEDQIVS
jgi:hypothetical protein